MSLLSLKTGCITLRFCLAWLAVAVMSPLLTRASCPCGDDGPPVISKAPGAATQPSDTLRVCTDPNNLPFSNRKHEGFEDKVAALIATDLGLKLEYDWLPQRLGFYRTAFKTFNSDLVMAAPAGFNKALITIPYYRSTYVFVTRKGATPPPRSLDDPRLQTMKIGVPLSGGANTPPTHALAKRNLIDNVTGYPVFDESEGRPSEKIVSAVATGEIDVAIMWGPPAGYFARQQKVALEVTPVTPTEDFEENVSMPFTFEICIALRRSDADLQKRIDEVITRRQADINHILDDYAIPRLPLESNGSGLAADVEQKLPSK